MRRMDVVVMLHSHLPWVLNHGRWPHGSDWLCEAALDSYLPLVEVLRRLEAEHVASPLTIGFTPVLANQLAHPAFGHELDAYLEQRLASCDEAPASLAATGDEHLLPLAAFWRDRLLRLRRLFHDLGGDLPGEFRRHADAERIELTTSAATHGFLPLLGHDASIRLQLTLGAVEHRRIFGRAAEGCWVPECAWRPAGYWEPIPGEGPRGDRAGLEAHLAWAGFRYAFADAHLAGAGAAPGLYGELLAPERDDVPRAAGLPSRTPYAAYQVSGGEHNVAALIRDPRSSMQVWSRHMGYPGAAAYLEFHKIRWPGGLRLWRVSRPGSDLGEKEPYDTVTARAQASEHARHFADLLDNLAREQHVLGGAAIVAPFDTELFGHWWFEGPDFLADLYSLLPGCRDVRPTTAAQHLDAHGTRDRMTLAPGSWGRHGDFSMWRNREVDWTWTAIWQTEERFWALAARALPIDATHEVLAQTARALLLLQSSDWQFIMTTGEAADYATRRFTGHAMDCHRLLDALEEALAGADLDGAVRLAREYRARDDIFPDVVPSIASALANSAVDRPQSTG